MAGAWITSVPSGIDRLDLAEGVCPGKKFNGIPNWGCVTCVADELGGIDATGGGV